MKTVTKSNNGQAEQYYKRFTAPKAEIHIIESRCKGCGFCVEFCPTDVLEISEKITEKGYHPPRVKDLMKCVACNTCELLCPEFAIFVTKRGES